MCIYEIFLMHVCICICTYIADFTKRETRFRCRESLLSCRASHNTEHLHPYSLNEANDAKQ